MPFIDVEDVAAVTASALTEDGHDDRVYDLSGPETLGWAEATEVIAKAIGRELSYVDVPPADWEAGAIAHGVPADYAAFLNVLFSFIRGGHEDFLTDGIQQALARPPRRSWSRSRPRSPERPPWRRYRERADPRSWGSGDASPHSAREGHPEGEVKSPLHLSHACSTEGRDPGAQETPVDRGHAVQVDHARPGQAIGGPERHLGVEPSHPGGHVSDGDPIAPFPMCVPGEEEHRMALSGRPLRPPDLSAPHAVGVQP